MTTLSKKAGKHADLQRDPCPRSNKPKRYGPEDDNTLCLPRSKVYWLLAMNVNPAHVFNEGSFHQSDWFTVLAMVRMFHNDNRLSIVLGHFSENRLYPTSAREREGDQSSGVRTAMHKCTLLARLAP